MLRHRKVTQVLPETALLSFIQKMSTELLLLAGTVPGAEDLTVNVAGQFSCPHEAHIPASKGTDTKWTMSEMWQVPLRKPKLRSGQGGWAGLRGVTLNKVVGKPSLHSP